MHTYICFYVICLKMTKRVWLESILMWSLRYIYIGEKYLGCLWLGDARGHGISSHDMEVVPSEQSGLSRRMVNIPLQWRHNARQDVSNHRLLDCLLNLCPGVDRRKHQSCASLAFVRAIHRWPMDSPHIGPVTPRKVSIWWRHYAKQHTNPMQISSTYIMVVGFFWGLWYNTFISIGLYLWLDFILKWESVRLSNHLH